MDSPWLCYSWLLRVYLRHISTTGTTGWTGTWVRCKMCYEGKREQAGSVARCAPVAGKSARMPVFKEPLTEHGHRRGPLALALV